MATRPTKSRAATTPRRSATPDTPAQPTLTRAHVQGFIAGGLAGVMASFGIANWTQPDSAHTMDAQQSATPPTLQIESEPRFDFYEVLPNQALDLNPDIEPADLRANTVNRIEYLLQAGSFREQTDADRRRGELALLGLEATVEPSEGSNGLWYRVYLGPFTSRSEMARARSLTAQADMDTLLLKRQIPAAGDTP